MASKNNCLSFPEAKKEQMGCGVWCDCPRMKNNLSDFDWVITMQHLYDSNRIGLKDMDAKTYNFVSWFSTEVHNEKHMREEQAKAVQEMLGVKK
jgi:hypothetical protein